MDENWLELHHSSDAGGEGRCISSPGLLVAFVELLGKTPVCQEPEEDKDVYFMASGQNPQTQHFLHVSGGTILKPVEVNSLSF